MPCLCDRVAAPLLQSVQRRRCGELEPHAGAGWLLLLLTCQLPAPALCLQSRRREQERLERLDEEWEAQKQKEEFEKKQVRRSCEWLAKAGAEVLGGLKKQARRS